MKQVLGNPESREWQYGLRDRAGALGWPEPVVIDEDLGPSGGGGSRPGFDRMLGAVCRGEIGIILAVDATRLARNGMEWHRLIDHCALVGCLLADEQSVYDPRIPSDRLMLGVQGAMSKWSALHLLMDPPAPRGMCPDADDPAVEAVRGAVSNPKAPELKPGRRHAHHGGILAPGGRRWEPARTAVAGETR